MEAVVDAVVTLANPWGLSGWLWLAGVIGKEVMLQLMDAGVRFLSRWVALLPSRTGDKKLYQRPLDFWDHLYLGMNSVIEMTFISHLLHYLWYSDKVDRPLASFGILNGPLALWLLVIFNDMFYAPLHRLLHHPLLYRWIHKHHHRVVYPTRGNVDARNEHPLEQILAMTFWYLAVQLATALVGMHAVVIPAHISVMVVFACFNHTAYDLSFTLLGIQFEVRAHEMHHRRPDKNFGQLIMWFDKLMGTYVPYATHAD